MGCQYSTTSRYSSPVLGNVAGSASGVNRSIGNKTKNRVISNADGPHISVLCPVGDAEPKPKPKTTNPAAPKTSKAVTPPNTSKAATLPKPSLSLKASSTKSSSSVAASTTANFANKCAQIGRRDTVGQLPERRDLEDMGSVTRDLHDLIVKRGAKSGTGCDIKGWKVPDPCSDYTWGGPLDKQALKPLTTYESEHILAWQTITGFLDYVNRLPAY
ncbi:hypothetical protein BU25DRAFT_445892 [Macroventuria anomochaeta]|uniref:Uncharacterized protein n=1 Tax=Macroventuria anomochaeta TaxID=301207 RepID=A0ACB6SE08_9PLEO|nr:uncharacterized protein BU25DRAFT_445892 [Macroventuria anomochaeta]KAF2631840.1 hypothetical protein BU25DRAFT_445892 [Macroventuria anomochaeta]